MNKREKRASRAFPRPFLLIMKPDSSAVFTFPERFQKRPFPKKMKILETENTLIKRRNLLFSIGVGAFCRSCVAFPKQGFW